MISKPSLIAVPLIAFLTFCYQLNLCPSYAIGVDRASSGRLHTAAEFEFTCRSDLARTGHYSAGGDVDVSRAVLRRALQQDGDSYQNTCL